MCSFKFYSPITVEIMCCGEKYETSPQKYLSGINNALAGLGKEEMEYYKGELVDFDSITFSVESKNENYYLVAACSASEDAKEWQIAHVLRDIYASDNICGVTQIPAKFNTDVHTEELFITVWDSEKSFILSEQELEERLNQKGVLLCRDCKHLIKIGNTDETGAALCGFPQSYEPTTLDTPCRYLPEPGELRCGDCARFGNDFGCFTCSAEDSAISKDGSLCMGFTDKNEETLFGILAFWKHRGMYDREKIYKLLDRFESEYKSPLD